MNQTLGYLLGKRMWWIGGLNVWGELAATTPKFLISESDAGGFRILRASYSLGGMTQDVRFGELVDVKGNLLPSIINRPRVVPISRGATSAVIQGEAQADSFRIAKANATSAPVLVDLLIIEMGE